MINRQQLNDFYHTLLNPDAYKDYGPNGLQIEGTDTIDKIAFAVSATRDSISQAIEQQANALVVHHGLFWGFHGARTLTGPFAKRVLPLVRNNMSLFAYHLPLDGHPDIGNAAVLGRLIGCMQQEPFGDYKGCATGIKGTFEKPLSATQLRKVLESVLNHPVILASPNEKQSIHSIGIITGGANSEWKLAAKEGLDAYLTGEISEHDWHDSQEQGIHLFAGGHHATERFGIKELMRKTELHFEIKCSYIDSDNPV